MTPDGRSGLLPARHLARYREIAGVLADEGLHTFVDAAGLGRLVPRKARLRRHPDEFTLEQHVRHALERLGVTFIKVGQAVSTRTDIIPPALADELRKLQDSVRPEPFEVVRRLVEQELEKPLEDLFVWFETEPFGAASIGQVHKASLFDGTEVAVKVQRPGVRRQVETDLEIVMMQAEWANEHVAELRSLNVAEVASEFAEAVRRELDYAQEARSAEKFWRMFREDPAVKFPRVFWSHTTSRVLTLELLDGVRMNDMDALEDAECDRQLLAYRGINAYLRMIFEEGFFHADPHPGNFIALPDNRVGFTDFGRTATVSRESRDRFLDLLWSGVNNDAEYATETFLALASAPNINETALQKDVGRLIGRYRGRELGLINPTELFNEILGLLRRYRLGVPGDFALIIATLGVLEGVGTMLDPAFDFATTAEPFVEHAMRERSSPVELLNRAAHGWRRGLRFMEGLPTSIDRILRRASKGEIRIAFVPRDYDPLLHKVAELANRLAFAMVVAALVIGASLILSASSVSGWVRHVGEVGLVLAFVVTIWFLGSIVASHYRGRRSG